MKTLHDIKKLLKLGDHHNYADMFSRVEGLTKERDEALQLREAYNSNVKDWRELCNRLGLPSLQGWSDVLEAIDTIEFERDALRDRPDATQPQLSEIRYVLHGDIQPCSVLYSDDTTTLLRLDEGDIMCETDTIEWSDSVTYRCQELLKSAGAPGMVAQVRIATVFAQLVRDERILLNDNGDDSLGADAKREPSCNNAYKHTDVHLAEESYRNMGYSTEQLVVAGLGHYVPAPAQPDTERGVASRKWADKQREHLASQPKQER